TLTFTPGDWFTPQTVTVRAVQDNAKEGFHYSRITHRITSSLDDFLGLTQDDVLRGLAARVNGDLASRLNASVSGQGLVLSGPAFVVPPGDQTDTTTGTRAWSTASLALTGPIASGTTWTVRLNDVPFSYTADMNDMLADAALGLAAAINTGTGYTATANGTS